MKELFLLKIIKATAGISVRQSTGRVEYIQIEMGHRQSLIRGLIVVVEFTTTYKTSYLT